MSQPSIAPKKRPGTPLRLSVEPRAETVAADLVELLPGNAPAEDFAARLALLDALPAGLGHKNSPIELGRMAMAWRNRPEQHEQRERGMLAFIDAPHDLARRPDLPQPP